MRLIKINDVARISYQFRHWGKWYWIAEDGKIVRIDKAIKTAEEINNG